MNRKGKALSYFDVDQITELTAAQISTIESEELAAECRDGCIEFEAACFICENYAPPVSQTKKTSNKTKSIAIKYPCKQGDTLFVEICDGVANQDTTGYIRFECESEIKENLGEVCIVDCPKIIGIETRYDFSSVNGNIWTLFSKCQVTDSNQCDLDAQFSGIVQVGSIPSNSSSVHPSGPQIGQSINGWYVHTICAETQPANDGNFHYWISGSPDDYGGFTMLRTNPDSQCDTSDLCIEIKEILIENCDGSITCEYKSKDNEGVLQDYETQGAIKESCVDNSSLQVELLTSLLEEAQKAKVVDAFPTCDSAGNNVILQILSDGTMKIVQVPSGVADCCKIDDTPLTSCNYEVAFKTAGIQTITIDGVTIALNNGNGYDFSDTSAGANSPEMIQAQNEIQAYLDANCAGATINMAYLSISTITISITNSSCVINTADHSSNPGPHSFTENCN